MTADKPGNVANLKAAGAAGGGRALLAAGCGT